MAWPFPIRVLWRQSPATLRAVALPLLEELGDMRALTRLDLGGGVHGFASPAAAAAYVGPRVCPVASLTVQLSADMSIQAALDGRIGQFEHPGMDLLVHLRPRDHEQLTSEFRAFGTALVRSGARAVWFGAHRPDQTTVMDAEDAFDAGLAGAHPADPLPLSRVEHVSWLMLWREGLKADVTPSLASEHGVTGWMRADDAPWRNNVERF